MDVPLVAELRSLIPIEFVDGLRATFGFWNWFRFYYVFIGHSLFCSMAAKNLRDRCFVHYVLTFLWGNGGGVVTAFLLMAPDHAKLSFFDSNEILGIWTVCWWLVNYFPGELIYKLLQNPYIKVIPRSCTALLRAKLIYSRIDLAVKLYPNVVAAPIILGTLSGCGGRLIADVMLHHWNMLPGYAELSSPGFVSRSAAMAAVTYYVLGYVLKLLPLTAAAGLVITVLMVHTVVSELTGRDLDFTAPVAEMLHKLTLVPLPPRQPQPKPATVYKHSSREPEKASLAAAAVADGSARPAVKAITPPAKTPAAKSKAKTPAKSPVKTTPVTKGPAVAGTDTEAVAAATGNGNVCSVDEAMASVADVGTEVVQANDVKGLGEGSIAVSRPRRSQRRAAAYA